MTRPTLAWDGSHVKDIVTGETVEVHDVVDGWTVLAGFARADGKKIVVIEDLRSRVGDIVYLCDQSELLVLSKTLEPTAEPASGLYNGHTRDEVLGEVDVLRSELLASGHEPTFEEVAATFPPIRRARKDDGAITGNNPHTFVGFPHTIDNFPIYYGKEYGARLNPLALSAELTASVEGEYVEQGIIGGWLPTVRTHYPVNDAVVWDSVVFAGVHPRNMFQQPTFHRYLRIVNGRVDQARYFDSYLPYPQAANSTAEEFYKELFDLHSFWEKHLPVPMAVSTPLTWLQDFIRHAFALEAITRVGDHPRYGTVTQNYGGGEHDGFQDIFNTSVNSAVEWGMFDRARRYIDNYLTEFVNDNGSIDYRGPETGQYGRMLTTLAQYSEYSGDYEVLERYDVKIRAILQILTERLEAARALPPTDPTHGMIRGRQEADSSFVTADLALSDYDQPYWNNSAEAWRGFRDLSRAWARLATLKSDDRLAGDARELAASATVLREHLNVSVERSILTDRDMPYLPTYAGGTKYHLDSEYRSTPESFDDNRVWTEFMGSGLIPRETLDIIVAYQTAHRGSTLGIIGNRKHVVVFLAHQEGYGFLQHDMIEEFLLLYFSLIAHTFTRGTWSAFECVDMNRERAEHTPYAAAAELVIAPMTKWMLVFESPDDDSVWLGRATPREWLEDGREIFVTDAPTRYGTYSYSISSQLDQGLVVATVEHLRNGASEATSTYLRLRTPGRRPIVSVDIDGSPWTDFDTSSERILLPTGSGIRTITIRYN